MTGTPVAPLTMVDGIGIVAVHEGSGMHVSRAAFVTLPANAAKRFVVPPVVTATASRAVASEAPTLNEKITPLTFAMSERVTDLPPGVVTTSVKVVLSWIL